MGPEQVKKYHPVNIIWILSALFASPFVIYFHGIKYQKQKQTDLPNDRRAYF